MKSPPARYDFKQAHYVSRDFLEFFRLQADFFAKQASGDISQLLHATATITLQSMRQLPFSKWLKTATHPFCNARFELLRRGDWSFLTLDNELAAAIINKLLGGNGFVADKFIPFNNLEIAVNRKFMNSLLKSLNKTFIRQADVPFSIEELNSNIEGLFQAPFHEPCVACAYRIEFNHSTGFFHFLFPSKTLARLQSDPKVMDVHIEAESKAKVDLSGIEIPVKVSLGHIRLTEAQLQNIQQGDILVLNQKTHLPINLYIGGEQTLKGYAGLSGSKKAVGLISLPTSEKELFKCKT